MTGQNVAIRRVFEATPRAAKPVTPLTPGHVSAGQSGVTEAFGALTPQGGYSPLHPALAPPAGGSRGRR